MFVCSVVVKEDGEEGEDKKMRPVVRTAGLKCIFSLNMGDAHRGKLTHDFVILSRRHHHMLFVILFIFLLV